MQPGGVLVQPGGVLVQPGAVLVLAGGGGQQAEQEAGQWGVEHVVLFTVQCSVPDTAAGRGDSLLYLARLARPCPTGGQLYTGGDIAGNPSLPCR